MFRNHKMVFTIWEMINDMVDYEQVKVTINYSQTNDCINVKMFEEYSNILFIENFTLKELWEFASLCFFQDNSQSIVNWSRIKTRVAYRFMIMLINDTEERSKHLLTELKQFEQI